MLSSDWPFARKVKQRDSLVCKDTADNSREWTGSGGATDLDDVVGEGVLAEHLQRAAVVQQAPGLQTPPPAASKTK